jgi:4'-phosphopantetheinyl transferase
MILLPEKLMGIVHEVTNWIPAPGAITLAPDEVHVWMARLDQPEETVASYRAVLSTDERARADRFHFEKDRTAYTVARAALKSLLGRYLGVAPTAIQFQYSSHGKPYLEESVNPGGINFNISHSHKLALLAFAIGRQVGVDVERIRADFATLEIAERFFSRIEVAALLAQPTEQQADCFFNCWTRKEAYIKAIGEGLSCPLHRFDVTLGPDEPARLLATRADSQDASRWSMHNLDPGPGYKGAVIAEGTDWRLQCWRWSG